MIELLVKLQHQTEENLFTFKKGDLFPGLKTRSANSLAPVVSTREWELDNVAFVFFFCLSHNFIEIRHGVFTLPACGTASIQRCSQGDMCTVGSVGAARFVVKVKRLDIKIRRFEGEVHLHVQRRAVDRHIINQVGLNNFHSTCTIENRTETTC